MLKITCRGNRIGHAAPDHQLRRPVAARFEQDRVEPHTGLQSRRAGLNRLGPADFAALGRDRGVVRHVLRLERRDPDSAASQQPAQTRDQNRFSGIGAGARDQQSAVHVCERLRRR
ncbi:hypothetical protein ATCCBAA256_13430 [Mycobacterium montefiorense]|nr:hypothetical protein ATCCBAA256_13430 [Mycobacterium montefiorense]